MKKGEIITLAALLLIGAALIYTVSRRQEAEIAEESRREEQRGLAVRSANPEETTLTVSRTFTGDLSGSDQAVIYSEAPGRLREYLVKEGDEVEKDEVIALVDREVTGMEFEMLRVRSPIDGTITRLYLARGDTVNQQKPLAVAADLNTMKVAFHIPERDLAYVSKGKPALLTTSAWPEKTFEGEVDRISLSLERASRSAYAEAVFKNPESLLRPGMFAQLEVISRTIQNAIVLPEDAVVRDPDNDCYCVYIVEDSKAVKRVVETGYSQNNKIQITSGVTTQERVIIEGQRFVEDGQRVREIE